MTKSKKFGIFIYIFFLFFGPKIGTYLDTSIIASIIMIFVSAIRNDHKVKIPRYTRILVTSIIFILVYTVFVSLYNSYFDITFYGRMIRSMFSVVSISVFLLDNKNADVDELNGIIIWALLIHAAIVLVSSTVYINLQYMLRSFNGYSKTIRMFRSTGLMMGFDMSGLLCNLGLVLVMCKKRLNFLQFAVFALATLFTSRFSILFLVVIALIYIIVNLRNSESRGKKALLLGIGIPIAIFGIVLLIITTNSFYSARSGISSLFPRFYNLALRVNRAYNVTESIDFTGSRHFAITDDGFLAAFGTGVYGGADPGYTRFINCIGIVGLVLVIIWHIYAICKSININIINKRLKYNRAFIVFSIAMVLIGLNFKNSYFFTGSFFEFMMLQLFMFKFSNQYNETIIK